MRKPDEIAYYSALRSLGERPGVEAITANADRLSIPLKRAFGLIQKWSDRGWWDYGVSLRTGWFTPSAPDKIGVS